MKKSKVTEIKFVQEKDLQWGKFFEFEIAFENGDKGFYLSKSKEQDKFVKDIERHYTYTPHDKWPKVKPANPEYDNNAQSGQVQTKKYSYGDNTPFSQGELIVRQNALTNAVATGITDTNDILETAQAFADWVLKGNDNVKKVEYGKDDLPF